MSSRTCHIRSRSSSLLRSIYTIILCYEAHLEYVHYNDPILYLLLSRALNHSFIYWNNGGNHVICLTGDTQKQIDSLQILFDDYTTFSPIPLHEKEILRYNRSNESFNVSKQPIDCLNFNQSTYNEETDNRAEENVPATWIRLQDMIRRNKKC